MHKSNSRWVVALGLGAVLAGCSGHVDVGSDPGTAGSNSNGGSSNSSSDGGSGSEAQAGSGTAFDPTQEPQGTCPATCEDAAGSVQPLATQQEFFTAIVGRWLICGDGLAAFGKAPADAIGVEYAAPTLQEVGDGADAILRGDMYYLVQGSGGPERGQGFAYQLTYDVGGDAKPSQLNMHQTPTSGFGGSFLYSACPREWQLDGGSANPGATAVLVPTN